MLNKDYSQSRLHQLNERLTYASSSNPAEHEVSFCYAKSSSSEGEMDRENTPSNHEVENDKHTTSLSGSNKAMDQISFHFQGVLSPEEDFIYGEFDNYPADDEAFTTQNGSPLLVPWPDTPSLLEDRQTMRVEDWRTSDVSTCFTPSPPLSEDTTWDFDSPPFSPYIPPTVEPPPPANRSIYPLQNQPGYRVTVTPYQATWPEQFETISAHLHHVFKTSRPPAPCKTIEHIGSTSIPGIAAKPNIDVLVTFANRSDLEKGMDALDWEITNFERYTRVPNGGGIQGRESYKLYISETSPRYHTTPVRSVYLIEESEQNPAGMVQVRCYRSVRETLKDRRNIDLFQEYSAYKLELAKRVLEDAITYPALKNGVIRKILRRAGWTEDEIDEKERLSVQKPWDPEEPAF